MRPKKHTYEIKVRLEEEVGEFLEYESQRTGIPIAVLARQYINQNVQPELKSIVKEESRECSYPQGLKAAVAV